MAVTLEATPGRLALGAYAGTRRNFIKRRDGLASIRPLISSGTCQGDTHLRGRGESYNCSTTTGGEPQYINSYN